LLGDALKDVMGGGALNLDFMDELDDGRDLLDLEFED
jgi:hypothetical protein